MTIVKSWSRTTVWLHSIMLLLFVVMYTLAELMDFTHGSIKGQVIEVHKSLGVIIFALAWGRLLWNTTHQGPAPIGSPLQQKAAKGVHHLLYLLMILMPVSGYVMVMMHGKPVDVFGWFTLPSWLGANPGLKELSEDVHSTLGTLLLILAGGHGALALYHHFILKDETLRRMSPL